MAAAICALSSGSGLKKLDEFLLKQSILTRPYLGSKPSSCLCNYAQHGLSSTYRRQLEVKQWNPGRRVCYVSNETDYSDTIQEDKEEDISKVTLIWRAIKLPIYSVALIPLTVGSAAAYLQTGIFSAGRYIFVLISSVLIITWLNLSNDVYDFDTGADKNKKESVVNLVGSRTGTFVAAYSFLALGFILLIRASIEAGNKRAILLLACAIISGYIYQCPPFRLSYQGLGEPLCFAAFGPFATTAFYLLQGSSSGTNNLPLSGSILSASFLVGLTTSLILFCSHFHQIEGDKAVGKMSPLVRIGTQRGSGVVKLAVIALYILLFTCGLFSALPLTCMFLCALTMPMAKLAVSFVEENHKDKQKIFMAKYYCVRLHTLFGAALAAGLVVARLVPQRYMPQTIFS
ncbi:2-carboxy-1,4-naphthoquinone phytyltransferase, chloroplastic isoform X1 [Ziziphus jujuba]|uniref:2-carboxy-1,4-naphthoquinone phytyltransferase, chloroplastic isoform X1 n=1 Tax=Ziziphus jujuba TaxID=326968 RepID=A0A6P6GIN6_ZIZJJ|nr:2-carboxy-1,4-naphthoquinone phytyltransferase, chloroplastic isoform X1 [Ziziphus jujuba]XP_024933654.3 2-carboxy-1,4-naphthoquinone phytyltransferase, chloroplastic isoform X1 [Ziziphus jujuba]XP_024933655.3 2-carboxy-1,4-naphthoquinone phytyltransferase, chloroplastic isoform X1 [Ziziphus jujuba]